MISELSMLRIEKIIAHEVYSLDNERKVVQPKYSSSFTNLDVKGINTFQERIVDALGNDSHCLEMSVEDFDGGSAFDLCNNMLDANNQSFIQNSCRLADKLAESHTSRNIPGGILVIFSGVTGSNNHKYIGIIKAELHNGFSLQEASDKLLLQFLSDLLLTPQQKLYKIAIFISMTEKRTAGTRTQDDFTILVYDHNMSRSEPSQAARYFYYDFLGCIFSPTDQKLTNDFYHFTKEFIDGLDIASEDKLDLHTSLYTYLKISRGTSIQVAEYAQSYLQPSLRDNYQNHMSKKEFPAHAIRKDITYLKNKLRRRNIKFTSDVKLNAPTENFEELIKVKGGKNGKTIVEISGIVEEID